MYSKKNVSPIYVRNTTAFGDLWRVAHITAALATLYKLNNTYHTHFYMFDSHFYIMGWGCEVSAPCWGFLLSDISGEVAALLGLIMIKNQPPFDSRKAYKHGTLI